MPGTARNARTGRAAPAERAASREQRATAPERASQRERATQRERAASTERDGGNGQAPAGDAQLPYEQAREQLAEVVRRLEGGGLTLEESLDLWERGERLAAICTDWLEGARARLTAVTREQSDPGEPRGQEAPF